MRLTQLNPGFQGVPNENENIIIFPADSKFLKKTDRKRYFEGDSDMLAIDQNIEGEPWVTQRQRPRRNRRSAAIRDMVQETNVRPSNLIQPYFIHDVDRDEEISSMPGQKRLSLNSLLTNVDDAVKHGVKTFMLFPKIEDSLKSNLAEESYNPDGIVPRAVKAIKSKHPEVVICTDVALDPYSSAGHDGVVIGDKIVNDITVQQLCKQALCHARAGCDYVSPSDMQDGRIRAIRDTLDMNGFTDTGILSYSAKYASSFYGPFRDALQSHPGKGDKKTYQQDPSNVREAVIEAQLDEMEGADILLVKPALPYLDVIKTIRDHSNLPVAAYQVSGEYAMIKAAAEKGWLDEKKAVMESVKSIRRAGADAIVTYHATDIAKWLEEEEAERSY